MIDFKTLSHDIIQYRRDLHQIPELGFYVYKTSAYVKNILSGLSCRVDEIVKTGVIAFFDFGREQTVAFRADMDALPITEAHLTLHSTKAACMPAATTATWPSCWVLPEFWTITIAGV